MEQIMECLLAKIDANQVKVCTNLKKMKEEMTARLEAVIKNNQKMEARIEANIEKFEVLQTTLVSWMDIHQVMTEAIPEEIIAKMDARQERMRASVNAWWKEMTSCLESKELTSVEIQSVAVHEEVPKEEAAEKTVIALKERYGDQHLAIGHHR
jgi:phosphoribosylformimino-5-aminoimidazole carboxamide ribonucleotide (ProFAR) isomerase